MFFIALAVLFGVALVVRLLKGMANRARPPEQRKSRAEKVFGQH